MELSKSNRLTSLSDTEFLSFLYSKRDREENLATYQGWNLWAMVNGGVEKLACERSWHTETNGNRLKQISKHVPALIDDEEYKNLLLIVGVLLDRTKEMMDVVMIASDKINMWFDNNICKKYGGVRIREWAHRHDNPLLLLRLQLLYYRIRNHFFGSRIRKIKISECAEKSIVYYRWTF